MPTIEKLNMFDRPFGAVEGAEWIVLGSFPGTDVEVPFDGRGNQMWTVLPGVFGESSLVKAESAQKIEFLVEKRICLGDVLKVKESKDDSTLDGSIVGGVANDYIREVAAANPEAKILCAGKTAHDMFKKHFPELADRSSYVLSTSGLCTSYTVAQKIEDYKKKMGL